MTTQIEQAVRQYLQQNFGAEADSIAIQIDPTRKEFEGEWTVVVFPFVKLMRTKPEDAAQKLGEHLQAQLDEVVGFNVIKGFLNLKLSDAYWTEKLNGLISDANRYQRKASASQILVEFSSPNTNKPLHLGHLRNNFLGYSVSLIKTFEGNDVIKTQIINDRGVHICKSMLAWQKFGDGETPQSAGVKGDKLVGKYYVIFDQHYREAVIKLVAEGKKEEAAKREAPLMQEVQAMLVKWEQNDPDVRALWEKMNGWVYTGFDETYKRMGVSFDKLYYESDTFSKGKDIVLNGLDKGIFFKKENGSVWCDLTGDGLDEKLLIRADGTTVYMTQDIGTAVQRYEDYPQMQQAIYTVGDEQDYHFKVLFKILEKLGYEWAPACEHLSYGMVDLPSGKMKSREGTVVDADDLMAEVVEAARASSEEKGKLDELNEAEQEALFEMLGIGALKFFLLRVDPKKRMMFDPVESVSLNGDTGPFVQYTHARCQAVLRKGEGHSDVTGKVEVNEKERALIMHLASYRTEASKAAETLNPSLMANYCLDLAKLYNQFYQEVPILKSEGEQRAMRLSMTKLTAETLSSAMALLGIQVPERM